MNDAERKVLDSLVSIGGGDYCFLPFDPICRQWGIDRKTVRRACRSLKRKGFAKFKKGLWSDDGEPAGSGYAATPAGIAALQALTETV